MIKSENGVTTIKGSEVEVYKDFGFIIQDVVRKTKERGSRFIDEYTLKNLITAGVNEDIGELYVSDPKMNEEVNAMVDEVIKAVNMVRKYMEEYAAQAARE